MFWSDQGRELLDLFKRHVVAMEKLAAAAEDLVKRMPIVNRGDFGPR